MRWCAKNEDIGSFTDGPTLCFLQSILCDLFNTFFILIFLYRIGQLVNRVTFDFIEDHTRRLLRVFQFLALSEFVLSISLGFSQDESYSVAFYILTEAIAWLSVFVIVTLEVWKIQRWPWLIIKVYLGFSLFSDIMISSIVLHDSNSTATEIGICLTQIIIDLILLLISLFKDLLRSPDDLAKEELKRYSVEFLGSDPMRRSRTKEDTNTVKQLWKFFRATEDGEGISGSRSLRLRSSAAETKRWSLFGNASSGSTSKRIFEASDQMKDLISNEEEHGDEDFEISFRSSMNSQHHASFVESAIDRNSLGSGGVTTNRDSSLLKSLFSGWGGQRYSSVGSDDDLEKRSPLLSRNHHDEAALLKKEEPIRYVPTKAINRVFEENQAKISASNPVLEPRGSETSINFTAYTENPRNGNNSNYNTQTTRDSLIALNKTPFSDTDAVKYTVNVQRWGIRTRKANTPNNNTPNLSTSSTPVPFGDPSNIEKVKSSDNLAGASTINQDFDSYVYERPKTEIEFEIVITAQLLSSVDEKDWGDSTGGGIGGNVSGGNDKNSQRWIVWRTSVEVHKLHSMMVLQLGDLTPRPPRLVSAQSGGTNFTHTELISDMRAITIFVNALLRLKDGPSAKPIVDFLELERSKALFSHRTQTLVSGSGDDNDRIDIVLSRNSENQESVTGTDVESRTGRVGLGLGDVASGTNSPKGGLPTGAGAGAVRNNVQSLMDVAELDAANNPNNQHEKWRKLFYQMRIKLKPHDIAVRCRLFEGVISGGEIAAWLIRSTSATGADAVVSQVNNRSEACAIGQELVRCGLITPVCSGFHDDDHDVDIDTLIESEMANTDRNSIIASTPVVGGGKGIKPVSLEEMNKFSDLSGYIYRLPVKSGTAGSWSLFGANITIKIPMMTMADENESMKSTRDTVVLTIDNGILAADAELEPTVTNPSEKPSTGGHVKYVIDINHGDDTWQSAKRYREFEALHKNLLKEGIRPDAPLPSKSFVNAFVRPVGFAKATLDETRRAGLETYLSSAVQAVIDNGNEKTRIILAQFLDDEFNNLRLVNSNENDGQLK